MRLYAADEEFRNDVRLASRVLYLEYMAKTERELATLRGFLRS
jgi:hypothetical protein